MDFSTIEFTATETKTLNRYSMAIFGCGYVDLSDEELTMLIYHICEREPSFMSRGGVL
jgi:hypothetical protein